ncbi:hypothetical protein MHM93_08885 [Pseudoalteromonas sp. MM17-2]|uniref:hypothetical protein n=1 Tax=Pseudoalteromonas sp. MM17-2 TaxID=2917753 RepID=UPI001EF4191A|nr:hypothetical protein [Pseudoalteromonas sp. MM17-2]MCG7544296.1 hypothetical protein [Pseudoalteromonas sp. MM17-2]
MRAFIITCVLYALLSAVAYGQEKIAVIVNKANPTQSLTTKQLVDLYMGRLIAFPSGEHAAPLDMQPDSLLREQFYQGLTKRPIGSINAYWSRVKFSGHAKPPLTMASSAEVIKRVREIDNAIGYVKLKEVTNDVKVVYTLVQ